jgi:hypothetical protein
MNRPKDSVRRELQVNRSGLTYEIFCHLKFGVRSPLKIPPEASLEWLKATSPEQDWSNRAP